MTGPAGDLVSAAHDSDIVEEIARSRRRARGAFRATFTLTWVVLVGILVGSLLLAGKIDGAFIATWAPYILGGIPITIFVSITSIALAIILATLGALGRLSRNPVVYGIASFYVSFFRGTPLLLQILFIFLALPQAGIVLPPVPTAIVALSLNYGSYMTEVFRSGIEAVPHGQVEAAQSLGMSPRTTFRRIVVPQAFRIVTPAIGNDFVAMIKDSSLAYVVGVQDVLWRAQAAGRPTFQSMQTLLVAAFVYWVLTILFSLFQGRLERRMATGDRVQGKRP